MAGGAWVVIASSDDLHASADAPPARRALSFGYFSFAQAKKSDAPAAGGSAPAGETCNASRKASQEKII
jgi:hypothetical protein